MNAINLDARTFRLETAMSDFAMMREDLRQEDARTHAFLAPLDALRIVRASMRPLPAERVFVLKLSQQCTPVFVTYTTRAIRNIIDDLGRFERPEIERMHGISD